MSNIIAVNQCGDYATGRLSSTITIADIERVVGFKANVQDDPMKVTHSWGFTVDGVRCGIWDYKGAKWSVFDPQNILPALFEKPAVRKGLSVSIYKNPMYAGCSNHGVSETHDRAILIGAGIPEIFAAGENDLVLELVPGNLKGTAKIVPLDKPKNSAGPMMGGSFVYTSNSRFSEAVAKICGHYPCGAIPLHDRFETAEENRRYSA